MAIGSEMKNRFEIEIMAAILGAAVSNWEYKTTIMNNASVSHSQLSRYLTAAVEKKLNGIFRGNRPLQNCRSWFSFPKKTRTIVFTLPCNLGSP